MKARDVTVGTRLWRHGYLWEVTAVHYDPQGNASLTEEPKPRFVFTADQVSTAESLSRLPQPYAKGMTLGFLPDAPVTLD